MSNSNLSLRNKISKSLKSTLEGSSIYAIPKILKTENNLLKVFFLACLLTSIGVLGWFMSKTISDYLSWPVITNIVINHVQQLTFPIVTICNLNGFTSLDNALNICVFNRKACTKENDFELAIDPYYGQCLRFNTGKNWNGTKTPLKMAAKGTSTYNALEICLLKDSDEKRNSYHENGFIIFISNQTVDSTVETGIKLSPGTSTDIKLNKYTIMKQPKPYSSCLNGLTSVNSYNSECYKKTLQKSKSGKYHYTDCKNMCTSKLLGDKCNFQTDAAGITYYDNMTFYKTLDFVLFANSRNSTLLALFNTIIVCIESTIAEFSSSTKYIIACDCPLECQTTGFSYSISSAQFPKESWAQWTYDNDNNNNSFADFSSFYNHLKQNLLFMRIYFEDATEAIISEEPKYSVADLVSSLGGTISLFTGFSFLSLIEIIEIFANIGFIIYGSKRKLKTEPENDSIEKINSTEMQKMRLEIEKNLKNKIKPEVVDFMDQTEKVNSAELAEMKSVIEKLRLEIEQMRLENENFKTLINKPKIEMIIQQLSRK